MKKIKKIDNILVSQLKLNRHPTYDCICIYRVKHPRPGQGSDADWITNISATTCLSGLAAMLSFSSEIEAVAAQTISNHQRRWQASPPWEASRSAGDISRVPPLSGSSEGSHYSGVRRQRLRLNESGRDIKWRALCRAAKQTSHCSAGDRAALKPAI